MRMMRGETHSSDEAGAETAEEPWPDFTEPTALRRVALRSLSNFVCWARRRSGKHENRRAEKRGRQTLLDDGGEGGLGGVALDEAEAEELLPWRFSHEPDRPHTGAFVRSFNPAASLRYYHGSCPLEGALPLLSVLPVLISSR
jgi:hypothetical protein